MKIALVQLDYHVGNFEQNTRKIIDGINRAKEHGADLAVFAELAICGYPPRDFLEFSHFIELCYRSVEEIATHCLGIAAIVGAPSKNPETLGKDLFNSAFFLKDGKIDKVINKSLLPNYDVFDEYRYFEPNRTFECIELNGKKIALTICEDLWNVDEDPLYVLNPMEHLVKENPDFAVNIAASPFSFTHGEKRIAIIKRNASLYGIPFFYVNHTGAQTELIFDGGSMAVSSGGDIQQLKMFEEDMQVFDLEEVRKSDSNQQPKPQEKYELIYRALVEGISDYFQKLGFKKATLGMSGGIDSALVFAIAVKALGKENVVPVLMPSMYSSQGSVDDSLDMIIRIGTDHHVIPITEVFEAYERTLSDSIGGFDDETVDVTEQNLQARIRGALLMALSNKFGFILLNTSNKSEFSVGYSTIYGDMIGALSVLGDLYKTEVYELARYVNQVEGDIIPGSILEKAPSAELKPGQKDQDSLPAYEELDPILFQYIEKRQGPREIIAMGYDSELVYRILKMVNTSEYKRFQSPPVLRLSDKSFGSCRRLPIVAKYLS